MPKKACCCVPNCCDPIFFTDFITIAGETLDDAAPVHVDDIVVLVMNRPSTGRGTPQTIYGVCPNGQESLDCYCLDCNYLRSNWCVPGVDENGQPKGFCPNCDETPDNPCNWNNTYGSQCGSWR
jgi:hypothetical protein